MKQIIVNVDGLTIEEKKRVSEALAKITNEGRCEPTHWDKTETLYAPSNIGFSYFKSENPTHTPRQVLEMVSSVDQDVILADTLIITDSAGNIIYDSTLDAWNHLIKKRSKGGPLPDSGASVKFDKNGMAVMVEKRKVRKDFDPRKEYSVNVEDCTEEEKKEVQQAFFDVGFKWISNDNTYKSLDAVQYSNAYTGGEVTTSLMYGDETNDCNMTAKEFLELVYEQGHVHSEQMMRYAEDAKTHAEPWELWEYKGGDGAWIDCHYSPAWATHLEYRRKPKTHNVHGVEVPDLRVSPEYGEGYYLASTTAFDLTSRHTFVGDNTDKLWAERGLTYQYTDEGRQAAILHAKAMLGDQS